MYIYIYIEVNYNIHIIDFLHHNHRHRWVECKWRYKMNLEFSYFLCDPFRMKIKKVHDTRNYVVDTSRACSSIVGFQKLQVGSYILVTSCVPNDSDEEEQHSVEVAMVNLCKLTHFSIYISPLSIDICLQQCLIPI